MRTWCLVLVFCLLPLLARADDADDRRRAHATNVALGGYMLASFYDVIGTTDCVAKGTCVEANPLFRGIAKRNTRAAMLLKGGASIGLVVFVLKERKEHPTRAFFEALGLFGAQSFVAVHNYRTFTGRRQ